MAVLLKGTPVVEALTAGLTVRAAALRERGTVPCLAVVRVGERPDDLAYERAAKKRCAAVGIKVRPFVFPADVSQDCLLSAVLGINSDPLIHGCLLFRPLPGSLDESAICAALDPRKDVDGVTMGSMAGVYSGAELGFSPCTAQSCMELLRYYGIDPSGKRAVVIGRSLVIGRPVAMMLLSADATVTLCHTKTRDLPEITRSADLVVVAIGDGEAIGPEYFRAGQTVLDVGINWSEEKQRLVGDVDFERVFPLVGALSPTPSGVGSVTAAVLCKHVIESAGRSEGTESVLRKDCIQ